MRIKVSDDTKLVQEVREKLKLNDGYCPCKVVKDDSTKCMCQEFLDQASGTCHCGLYIKIEQ